MRQREAYLTQLGNNWYRRNKDDLGKKDDVVEALLKMVKQEAALKILEIGCANGWRLRQLADQGYDVFGIDPSSEAISDLKAAFPNFPHGRFEIGTADSLPWADGFFDCVIMGFCMWAMTPEDWFPAVAESDRVLRDGGILIIHDRFSPRPIRRPYPESGMDGMYQYTYDWSKLWLAHPAYTSMAEAMGVYPGTTSVEGAVMLHKDVHGRMLNSINTPEAKK